MKIKKYYLIVTVILLSSCNDYFDVSPKTDVKAEDLFQDERGFNDALIGVYTLMSTKQLYGDNLNFGFIDVLAQYYGGIRNNTSHTFLEATKYNYEDIRIKARIASIWSQHYKAIANLNGMLLFIDDHKDDFSNGTYNVFKGEAIALRAYLHFSLLRLFAPAPILGANEKAIPYMDHYTNEAQPAESISEILNYVNVDLQYARELMADSDPYGPKYDTIEVNDISSMLENREYRMNYYAVTAALAVVNQYQGNKDIALSYAQEIIGASSEGQPPVTLFNLSNLGSNTIEQNETIFGLNVSKLENYTDVYFGSDASLGLRNNWLAIDNQVLNDIYTAPGASSIDSRQNLFFGGSVGGERPLSKYFAKTTIPLLRISELYLIAADSDSNLNNALEYYNKFTASRGIESVSNISKEQLNSLIYKEYKKEFIGEGKLFWFYKLKNYETIGAKDGVKIENVEIYTLPIPDEEYEFGNL